MHTVLSAGAEGRAGLLPGCADSADGSSLDSAAQMLTQLLDNLPHSETVQPMVISRLLLKPLDVLCLVV